MLNYWYFLSYFNIEFYQKLSTLTAKISIFCDLLNSEINENISRDFKELKFFEKLFIYY